jgi:hypothetical protein
MHIGAKLTRDRIVMVIFMCLLGSTKFPDLWLKIIPGVLVKVFLDEITSESVDLVKGLVLTNVGSLIQSIGGLSKTKRLNKGEFAFSDYI